MKAITVKGGSAADTPNAFNLVEQPQPTPGANDLLVRISTIGMNPVDTKFRTREKGELVLGWDACGTVVSTGAEVQGFAEGDRVYYAGDITRPGTNSEYHLVDARIAAKAPTSISDADAAAMPLTSITAWEGLFDRLGFIPEEGANKGKSVLIIGGAGGVGSVATQIAKWAGLTVYSTASRPDTEEWVTKLGADAAPNHRNDLAEELKALGAETVDAIFCTTHLERHWNAMAKCIRPQGSVVFIDDPVQPLDLTVFKVKSVSLLWELMFTRSIFQTEDMPEQGKLLARVAQLIDEGKIKSTRTMTIRGLTPENIQAMHIRQESGSMMGKQVLEL